MRGNTRSFQHCTLKARELGFDATSFTRTMYPEHIAIRKSRDGQKVISLNDLPWADRGMIIYDLEILHHDLDCAGELSGRGVRWQRRVKEPGKTGRL